VQPGGQRLGAADGVGSPGQHQERRLKGIVGDMGVGDDAAADTQHHRTVPCDQRREGGLVAVAEEALQQRGVGRAGGLVQVADEVGNAHGHDEAPRGPGWFSTMIVPESRGYRTRIFDGLQPPRG